MAKVNVNAATQEELVEVAGLRPHVAEEVLKLREEHGGRIANLDELMEVKGIGEATVDHLREVLSVGKRPDEAAAAKKAEEPAPAPAQKTAEVTAFAAKSGTDTAQKGAEAARKGAEVMAQAAKSGAETAQKGAEITAFAAKAGSEAAKRTAERAAEAGREVARAGTETASRFAAAGADAARRAMGAVASAEKQAAERSSEATSQLSELFVGLVNEQMQHNVETLQAFAKARTFREAADVQGAYYRASIERMTQGTTRYVEVVSKLVAGMATIGRDEAKKAA